MRKKKLLYNTISGIVNQIVALICGFILPRKILLTFGSNVNGLVSSITQFLGVITMMDMGVGAVVESALYKPLTEKDTNKINELLAAGRSYFRKISYILIVYTLFLSFAFPFAFSGTFDGLNTAILVMAISISTIAQYYFGITYQVLLKADQKAYISLCLQCITVVLNTVLCVILIRAGYSIQLVKLASSIVLMLRPVGLMYYAKCNYDIDSSVKAKNDTLKQKWDGLAQHIAAFVVTRTDIVVLTVLSTLQSVSIYNVYHLVVGGLYQGCAAVMTGLQSLFGNLYAENSVETLRKTYSITELLVHFLGTLVFTCAGILFLPFLNIYTHGVIDAEAYMQPAFAWLLSIAYACFSMRDFYNLLIKATGKYRETRSGALIEAILNVVISVLLVKKYGLIGVAIGTLISMCYRMVYFICYIDKNILTNSKSRSFRIVLFDIMIGCIIAFTTSRLITGSINTYLQWIVISIKVTICAGIEGVVLALLLFKNDVMNALAFIKGKSKQT